MFATSMVRQLKLLFCVFVLRSPCLCGTTAVGFTANWMVCDSASIQPVDARRTVDFAKELALSVLDLDSTVHVDFELQWLKVSCDDPVSLFRHVEQISVSQCSDNSTNIVISLNGENAFKNVAYWTSVHSIPLFIGANQWLASESDHWQRLPLVVHTIVSTENYALSVANLLRSSPLNWQRVALIGSRRDPRCGNILDAAARLFPLNGIEIVYSFVFEDDLLPPTDSEFDEVLDQLAVRAHIVVFCLLSDSDDEIRFLVRAKHKNVLSDQFAYVRLLMVLEELHANFETHVDGIALNDQDLIQVFDVMPMLFDASFGEVQKMTGYWNVMNSNTAVDVAQLADCLILYASSLRKAMANGLDYNSAEILLNTSRKLDFLGYTGRVWFDDQGDRLQTLQMLPTTIMNKNPNDARNVLMQTEYSAASYKQQRWIETQFLNMSYRWLTADGLPPSDPPHNIANSQNLNPPLSKGAMAGIIIGAAAAFCILFGLILFFAMRRVRSRARATSTSSWRIKFADLRFISMSTTTMFKTPQPGTSPRASMSTLGGYAAASGNLDILRGRSDHEAADSVSLASTIDVTMAEHLATSIRTAGGDAHVWNARYGLDKVRVNLLMLPTIRVTRELDEELKLLRNLISADVARFVGLCVEDGKCCIAWEFAAKGSLRNIICRSQISVDRAFQLSILGDIARALLYLHYSPFGAHGLLNSYTCVVNDRFAVKLADFGAGRLRRLISHTNTSEASLSAAMPSIKLNDDAKSMNDDAKSITSGGAIQHQNSADLNSASSLTVNASQNKNETSRSTFSDVSTAGMQSSLGGGRGMTCVYCSEQNLRLLLWSAPELLRLAECDQPLNGTPQADIYAYGVIICELLTKHEPYELEIAAGTFTTAEDVVRAVRNRLHPPLRPSFAQRGDNSSVREPLLMDLARACWQEDPLERPPAKVILEKLKQISGDGRVPNFTLNLLNRLKSYANDLENIVAQRSAELNREKQKFEQILYQMIPRSIGEELLREGRVEPRSYASASICFSELANFTTITAKFSPLQIVDALNMLHTAIDAALQPFDVFQVETISDSSTMLVSGVPKPNGDAHAVQCALAALAMRSLKLPDSLMSLLAASYHKVQMKIGIHTGACVAGIIGVKMPRYCLFGDTVNTASRMQSTGVAGCIQVSKDFVETARYFCVEKRDAPELVFELRGNVEVKGKGTMETFWLVSSKTSV